LSKLGGLRGLSDEGGWLVALVFKDNVFRVRAERELPALQRGFKLKGENHVAYVFQAGVCSEYEGSRFEVKCLNPSQVSKLDLLRLPKEASLESGELVGLLEKLKSIEVSSRKHQRSS